ncbi:class I SAM-dependent methyltransferase [Hoeflea ulvae]|uniref:Class I SAM-dependent methyltransferase n=1 Tax=Hoeflea ulvae TaxID=2983764 RepID=A0ABT3YKG8_9HYPH|nr:class I SAM-dependent methyltransferase [Hoeflea ulvae]MCY0096400.1 class I SAM-dependent methyltransferase [Hoeflea ulvae]
MSKDFDQAEFWINRHIVYKDDPRSVGNAAVSVEANLDGEKDLQAAIAQLAKRFSSHNYSTVLDLGCGYGRVADSFISNGFKYTGIDISKDALETAKKQYPQGKFIQGDLRNIKLDSKFDVVSILYVLVHFVDDSDWKSFLRTACEYLTPGGKLVFADHFPTERSSPVAHAVSRPIGDYIDFFREVGMELDSELQKDFASEPFACVPAFRFAKKA